MTNNDSLRPGSLGGLKVKKANESRDNPTTLIYGSGGVGKTTLAASIADIDRFGPVLHLNVENGAGSIASRTNVDIVDVDTILELQAVFTELHAKNGAGYGTVIVDNLTEAQAQGFDHILKTAKSRDFVDFEGATFSNGAWNRSAQPLDSPVLTPSGWSTIGSLVIGSEVIGSDGKPTKVKNIYKQGIVDKYTVTFRDGSKVDCSDNHLWTVKRRHSFFKNFETITTQQLMNQMWWTNYSWYIPTVKPVEFRQQYQPVHAYLMGLYIAEGHSAIGSGISIASRNKDTIKVAEQYLPKNHHFHYTDNSNNYILTDEKTTRWNDTNVVRNELKHCGLFDVRAHDKFIPYEYKFGSVQQRLELLQGLMDGDGSVRRNGAQYASNSVRLCLDVQELVHSLGGQATITWAKSRDEHRPVNNVRLILPDEMVPFKLERKINAYPVRKYQRQKFVKSVELTGKSEMQCIEVEANDGLYVTNNYVLTHNSEQMRKLVRYFRDLPVYTIFVAWEKDYSDGGVPDIGPAFTKTFAQEMPGLVNDVFRMSIKNGERILQTGRTDRASAKDRTGLLPTIIKNPTMSILNDYWTGALVKPDPSQESASQGGGSILASKKRK